MSLTSRQREELYDRCRGERPAIRATLTGITWPMRAALCALAGGPATWLRGAYIDRDGKYHDVRVIKALVRRKLAERTLRPDGRKSVRLTDRGRWFAATALGEIADILAAGGHPVELAKTGTEG